MTWNKDLLQQAKHSELQQVCYKLLHQKSRGESVIQAWYDLAQSYYYLGEWAKAADALASLFELQPYHADARYLAADTARLAGDRETAWQHLLCLYPHSKRLKTWLYMAELVDSLEAWQKMHHHLAVAQQIKTAPRFHLSLNEYAAKGAQRGGDYVSAFRYWQTALDRIQGWYSWWPFKSNISKRHKNFTPMAAQQALEATHSALQKSGIPMFLISGTLLGCIREKSLLKHDHDIDIGIWDDIQPMQLQNAITQAGVFHVLPQRNPGCLRAKHLNGVAVDIFTHYRETNSYWHGGIKVRWHNTPFNLLPQVFLGRTYLIPADYQTYLSENYGAWQQVQETFDSTLDTPNAEILSKQELMLHVYQQLYKAKLQRHTRKIKRYSQLLSTFKKQNMLQ